MKTDPFHCEECGCALSDGEVFRKQDVCDFCDEDADEGPESWDDHKDMPL